MSPQIAEPNPYQQQADAEAKRRDRANRTVRLLKRLIEAEAAGDPLPSLAEILAMTGLPHPQVEALHQALPALLRAAEAERDALKRQLKLTRELRDTLADLPTPPVSALRERPAAPAPVAAPTLAPAPVVDEGARLSRVSARDLDALPYGAILMDDSGRIVAYNDTESRMARLPVEAVLGRNFFTEVAPCTRVKEFEGRFRALASGAGAGLATFDFTFPFPFGPQRVSVILTRHTQPGHVIMALIRR